MHSIDEIMKMLDWNNPIEEQERGIELGRQIKSINVFLQPCYPGAGKSLWENSAKILIERSDEELEPYLLGLVEWIRDINHPGAWDILERLQKFKKCDVLSRIVINRVNEAALLNEIIYIRSMSELLTNETLKAMLPELTIGVMLFYQDLLKKEYSDIKYQEP